MIGIQIFSIILIISMISLTEFFKNTNHEQTQIECLTERKVLHTINANCNSPVSVFANLIQHYRRALIFAIYRKAH